MNVKKYSIEVPFLGAEIQVEIDFSYVDSDGKKAIDYIKEMVEFWNGWENRLAENNNDYVMTFLFQLGRFVFNHAPNTVFDLAEWLRSEEGYCYLAGTCGIKILRYDEPEIGTDEIDITEI